MPAATLRSGQTYGNVVDGSIAAITATLPTAAVAGNLLACWVAGDKDSGALTMSDNGTSAGWLMPLSALSTSVSLYMAYKVAAGGETTITGTRATSTVGGMGIFACELEANGTGGWFVAASASNPTDESVQTSRSTGTTTAALADALALAGGAWDTAGNLLNPTWSNSYTTQYATTGYADTLGPVGLSVASLPIASGATTSSTLSGTGTGDQISAAVYAFSRFDSRLAPDAILAQTGLTGAVTAIQDDPDSPDGNWLVG